MSLVARREALGTPCLSIIVCIEPVQTEGHLPIVPEAVAPTNPKRLE